MALHVAQYTLDVTDLDLMAGFWSAGLDYRVERGDDGNAKLHPTPERPAGTPTVWLQASDTPKRGKNRLHLDLVADGDPGGGGTAAARAGRPARRRRPVR
ncbi:VOC family protein [Micromonospora sp. IBSANI012]|uniref:VOC family protein n=1 Tax=Micromonospora sp. IBSANI012 TaxID=3457761 RepID=UPI004058A64E